MLFSILIASLALAWLIFVIWLVDEIITYKEMRKSRAYITFNLFKCLYSINPEKWTLQDDSVWYHDGIEDSSVYFNNFFNLVRYRRWYKRKLKNDKKHRSYDKTATLVEYWKRDIQVYKENSETELEKSLRELKEYIKND